MAVLWQFGRKLLAEQACDMLAGGGQAVVDKTLAGLRKRKDRVYVPATVRLVAALQGLAPSLLDAYGKRFGLRR